MEWQARLDWGGPGTVRFGGARFCGAHGDAIQFIMNVEGLRFVEAVQWLAAEAGMAPQ